MASTEHSSNQNSYQPSGKIGDLAWIYFMLVCAVILPLIGALYAIIIWYMPITFFNPLFTFLFANAIMVVHNLLVIEYGKVRDITLANYSGHIAIATAFYAHWIVWIVLADGKQNLIIGCHYFLTHPFELISAIWKANQTSTWRSWPTAIVWIIEGMIVYFWVISSVKTKVRMPFSEVSNEWFKFKELPKMEFINEPSEFVRELESRNYERLNKLKPSEDGEASHSVFMLYFTGKDEYYLTIDNFANVSGTSSPHKFKSEKLFKYLRLDRETGKRLQAMIVNETPSAKKASLKTVAKTQKPIPPKKAPSDHRILKAAFYKKMGYTDLEIKEGEERYANLKTDADKSRFANIYTIYHPRLGQQSVYDVHGGISNSTRVVMINFAVHESWSYAKEELAANLFHSLNSQPVEGPQEFYDMTCWWIDFEPDHRIKTRLVSSLLDYTTIREDAKEKIIELIDKDGDVVKSLLFWLEHNFPRNYDGEFGKRVLQEIDQCRKWDDLIEQAGYGFEEVRRSLGLTKTRTEVNPSEKEFWLGDIPNYSNYSHQPLYDLQKKGVDIEVISTHMDEHPRSDYVDRPRMITEVRFNKKSLMYIQGPFVNDVNCKFLCCTLSWQGVDGLILIDLTTGDYYKIGSITELTNMAATPIEFSNDEFFVLIGGGEPTMHFDGGSKMSYRKNGYLFNIANFPEVSVTPYESKKEDDIK